MFLFNRSHALAFIGLALAAGCGSGSAPAPAGSGSPAAAPSGAAAAPAATAAAATAAAATAAAEPDAVVKSYLELGAAGDLSKVKDLVDPKCHKDKVGDVDAVKMLGARMTLGETTATVEAKEAESAKVKYVVKGAVEAKNAHTDTDIFGAKVEVKVGGLSMSGVTQSGVLTLKKLGGRWVVTCGA